MRFELPQGDALERISACGLCMDQIGEEAYAKVFSKFETPIEVPEALKDVCEPITGVRITIHQRCEDRLKDGDEVLERVDAR